jgi:CRP-like cAMP-binding protein
MDEMINFLLQFGHLNQQQINLIKSRLTEMHIKKGDYFSEAARVAQQVGFITEGIMRVCYYNNKGEDITRCFIMQNSFVVDMNSFYNQINTAEYVEAVTDCRLFVLERKDFNELASIIIPWSEIFAKITSSALMRKVQAAKVMISQDGTERYLDFLKDFPGVANRAPLSTLASYLGVTQSSLSRIRKNIQ